MKQYYIICDVSLCHDCNNCFMACKDEHTDNEWLPYTNAQPRHSHRWIDILRKERGRYPRIDVAYLPVMCFQCEDAPCVKARPDCIRRTDSGIVQIDIDKAKGDESVPEICPYGAISWNGEAGVAQKCTMCAHILEGGSWDRKLPRCVHSCPTGALEFCCLEPDEIERKIKDERLERYKPELCVGTGGKAHVLYRNLYRFEKLFIAGGLLRDGECAEGVNVTLRSGEVTQTQLTDCFGDFKFDDLDPGAYELAADGMDTVSVTISESVNMGSLTLVWYASNS